MLSFLQYLQESVKDTRIKWGSSSSDVNRTLSALGFEDKGGKEHSEMQHPISGISIRVPRHKGKDLHRGLIHSFNKSLERHEDIMQKKGE